VGGSVCLAHVNQSGSTVLGFRIVQIAFTKPAAFAAGIVASVFQGNAQPNDPACNLEGTGTFSWLLRFDTSSGMLETGGAKPSMLPAGPYEFVDQMVNVGGTFMVAPVETLAPLSPVCGFDAAIGAINVPIFLDAAATSLVLLPLSALHFHDGTLSPDLGCIGRYNATNLDPANSCLSDGVHPTFLPGASLDAFISLEQADQVTISALQETLCVLLTGNAAMYGTKNSQGVTVCKRDASNKLIFQGDWCAATNQPGGCADAMATSATFAAQAVKIQ
jgi:hypothetical protein